MNCRFALAIVLLCFPLLDVRAEDARTVACIDAVVQAPDCLISLVRAAADGRMPEAAENAASRVLLRQEKHGAAPNLLRWIERQDQRDKIHRKAIPHLSRTADIRAIDAYMARWPDLASIEEDPLTENNRSLILWLLEMHAICRIDPEEARARIRSRAAPPRPELAAWGALVNCLVERDEFETAVLQLDHLKEREAKLPSTGGSVIDGAGLAQHVFSELMRAGRVDQALDVQRKFERQPGEFIGLVRYLSPSAHGYGVAFPASMRDPALVRSYLDLASKTADPEAARHARARAALQLLRLERSVEAEALIPRMSRQGIQAVIAYHLQSGSFDRGRRLFLDFIGSAEDYQREHRDHFLEELVADGDVETLLEIAASSDRPDRRVVMATIKAWLGEKGAVPVDAEIGDRIRDAFAHLDERRFAQALGRHLRGAQFEDPAVVGFVTEDMLSPLRACRDFREAITRSEDAWVMRPDDWSRCLKGTGLAESFHRSLTDAQLEDAVTGDGVMREGALEWLRRRSEDSEIADMVEAADRLGLSDWAKAAVLEAIEAHMHANTPADAIRIASLLQDPIERAGSYLAIWAELSGNAAR